LSYSKLFEVANFNPPHLHLAPVVYDVFKFRGDLWHHTPESLLSCGIICVIIDTITITI